MGMLIQARGEGRKPIQCRQAVDEILRQPAGAGDVEGIAALIVPDAGIGAGIDQQAERLETLEPGGVEDRRLAMGSGGRAAA